MKNWQTREKKEKWKDRHIETEQTEGKKRKILRLGTDKERKTTEKEESLKTDILPEIKLKWQQSTEKETERDKDKHLSSLVK